MLRRVFTAVIPFALVICGLSLAYFAEPVKATSTVYIRSDGSVEPVSAPISTSDKITYVFTADIPNSIVVERNNIAVEGAGHAVQGTGSGNGVDLTGTSGVTIRNMKIKGFSWGIASNLGGSSSNNIISDNTIENNGDGIVLYSSTNCLIARNRIAGSTFQDGIWLYGCVGIQIVRNEISGNERGGVVFATSTHGSSVDENDITGNGVGILFDSGPNKVFHNNLMGNAIQACKRYSTSYANSWDDGYPSGGNYWNDYLGTDADGDGIGDNAYVIDEVNRDNYPLMAPWPGPPHWVIPEVLFGTILASALMAVAFVAYVAGSRRTRRPLACTLFNIYDHLNRA